MQCRKKQKAAVRLLLTDKQGLGHKVQRSGLATSTSVLSSVRVVGEDGQGCSSRQARALQQITGTLHITKADLFALSFRSKQCAQTLRLILQLSSLLPTAPIKVNAIGRPCSFKLLMAIQKEAIKKRVTHL